MGEGNLPHLNNIMKYKYVTGIVCPSCKEFIYSRAHYDCHYCSCGEVMVDGGFDYLRIGFKGNRPIPKKRRVEIPHEMTNKEFRRYLYDDWNLRDNKLGVIK